MLQKIGDASYGIYLTHVACLFVAFRLVTYFPGFTDWPSVAKYLAGGLLGFLPAYLLGWGEWQFQSWLKTVSLPRFGQSSWPLQSRS
jgi:peptidoglycan/LPS O-acetylase OafA/YrhL